LWSLATGDAAIKAAIVAAGALVPLAALVRDGDAEGKAKAAGALKVLRTAKLPCGGRPQPLFSDFPP